MAKKEALTSSVVSVSRNEINANIVQSLSGRVAGVEVTQNSGIPVNAANIRIRGVALPQRTHDRFLLMAWL